MTLQTKKESYMEKRKGSIWKFSFYHDYHLVLKASYRFFGVQDGDAFDITMEEQSLLEPEGVIYERGVLHPNRTMNFETEFSVVTDKRVFKKQYRKDYFKNELFDFFIDPLIGFSADSCVGGCGSTLLLWAIIIGGIVKFGFSTVLKWLLVIYLAVAVLGWLVRGFIDRVLRGGRSMTALFDECFDPSFIKDKFHTRDFGTESKKKGFFGKKK